MTLIDNIYISQILNDIRSDVILSDISDHYLCIASVNLDKKPIQEMRQFSTRKLTEHSIQQINSDLLMTDWTHPHQLTTNMAYECFNKKLFEIMDKHAPVKPT